MFNLIPKIIKDPPQKYRHLKLNHLKPHLDQHHQLYQKKKKGLIHLRIFQVLVIVIVVNLELKKPKK